MVEDRSFARQYEAYSGKTLGNYYLERLTEQGETGPIFQARLVNGQASQAYRLRFLALPAGLTPEERLLYLGHFQHETSQVAALQHTALLPLSDYGIFEGAPYLVSPDVPGVSLQSTIMKNGPLAARLASRYLDTIAMALEYMHQQGILHLNLNAQNIFLRADGQLLVAEAGLVRMLAPQMPGPALATSQQSFELENGSPLLRDRRGKALYGLSLASAPAPELLLGQSPDTATDVYALGALLYYLLTGHRVMRGSTLADIANQHLNAAVPSLNLWRQDLPTELDRLLSRTMAKNLAQRPRYPGTLANACVGIIAPGEERRKAFGVHSALPVSPVPSSTPALPQQSFAPGAVLSRRRVMTLIAASGGVTAAGVVVWVAGHSGGSAAPAASSGNASAAASTATSASPQATTGASSSSGHSGKVVAQTADVPLNSAKTFPIANSNNPGVLIHLQNNRFVAFNSTCTHAGCAVAYNRQNHLLECPCHGASFDPVRNAAVVSGPAPSPLTAIAITVNRDGTITTGA